MEIQQNLFIVFAVIVGGFLIVDLGYFNRKAHKVSPNSALIQTIFWIVVALAYAFLIFLFEGRNLAAEFMSAYVTEKILSVDNLFVIMLIFNFFKLEEKHHHRVLFWGIIGAIFFRGLFITVGVYIINTFHFVLYIFGAILLYTGMRFLFEKKEEHVNLEHSKIYRLASKYLPFSTRHHDGKFIHRDGGKKRFTILFMIIILVESTDIVFAVDSIPAAFAITQNAFIIFTSNVFAIMGLRALFFLLENVLHKFHHLQKGLAFILIFIGGKMLIGIFDIHISPFLSFLVIMTALGLSLVLSVFFPKKI